MYRKLLLPLIITMMLFLLTAGCSDKDQGTLALREDESVPEEYITHLKNRFIKDNPFYYVSSSSFKYFDTLKHFYGQREYVPLFIKHENDRKYVNSLLEIFSHADEHGLDKNIYHYDLINEELSKAKKPYSKSESDIYIHLANAEILTADAVVKYAYHLRYGVVNPKILFSDYSLPMRDENNRELFKPLHEQELIYYLKNLQPKDENYTRLQAALKYYSSMDTNNWDSIADKDDKFRISERLKILGFLDSTGVEDSVLKKSVKTFQKANGLIGDGTIGAPTLKKLNRKPDEYVDKIKLSMERFRWSGYRDSAKYILVNIPDFHVRLMEGGKERNEIRVCIGKKRSANYYARMQNYMKSRKWWQKPDDWETPQASGMITNIVLNPTWTVPASIVREEIYSETLKDPEYLIRKNFRVFQDGREVNVEEVNMESYSANNVPYTFVQGPGSGNALGKMKFMFKNPFGVYLHDTPTRGPFSNSNRAVSHGCVRVEKPYLLAAFLLEGDTTWNVDYMKIETGVPIKDTLIQHEYKEKRAQLRRNISTGKSTFVKLHRAVPVFVDYYTAWVTDEGKVNFRDDVYGKDKLLKQYLSVMTGS